MNMQSATNKSKANVGGNAKENGYATPPSPNPLPLLPSKLNLNPFDTEETEVSKFQKLGRMFEKYLLDLQKETIGDDEKVKIDTPSSKIHPHQISAVLKVREKILQDRSERISKNVTEELEAAKPVIIVAPTGSGKSGMIALLPYILHSAKVLVLTPSRTIGDQLAVTFGSNRKKPSFYQQSGICKDKKKLDQWLETVIIVKEAKDILQARLSNLVIVNAQKFGGGATTTLSQKNINKKLLYKGVTVVEDVYAFFEQFDTLLVDEAHHYPAPTWLDILKAFSRPVSGLEKKIVFLTATPYRQVRGKMVPILGEMQKDQIALIITPEEVKGTTTRRCEFMEDGAAATPENVTPDIVGILGYQEAHEQRFTPQCLVVLENRSMVKKWTQEMNALTGDRKFAVSITSKDPDRNLKKFDDGKYQVGVTCGLLKEGYDNPHVTLCVILRNLRSKVWFTQFTGRCMRLVRFTDSKTAKQGIDTTTGIILSYKVFNQKNNWLTRDTLAIKDPSDEDDEEDEFASSNRDDNDEDHNMDITEDEDVSMEAKEIQDEAWIPDLDFLMVLTEEE